MFFILRNCAAVRTSCSGVQNELCKISLKNNVSKFQAATLTRAAFRNPEDIPDIEPFQYHRKPFNFFNMIMDTHKNRVHKNAKIIVVDGPIASGKNKLAQQLAEDFDFLYLPQPNFDELFVSPWGFDYRSVDDKVPESCQTCDIKKFLREPYHLQVASMQFYMQYLRQVRYMEALRHIFATGEGIVTVRCPWSDVVFAKTMFQNKYFSKEAWKLYNDCNEASLWHYLRPHLVIYLDVPVDVTQENIKKRGREEEINTKVLNETYLTNIAENYKSEYLNYMIQHCHLLVYDWAKGGDAEVVVEDIEKLNFDNLNSKDERLKDWEFPSMLFKEHLKNYTANASPIINSLELGRIDCPEMLISGEDFEKWENVVETIPEMQNDLFYERGYNKARGENYWFNKEVFYFPDYVTRFIEKRKKQKMAQKQ